jgi:CubicO group peptidase (beta-lactamase class C family)
MERVMSSRLKILLFAPLLACAKGDPGPAPRANDETGAWPSVPALDAAILDVMDRDHVPGLAACITRDGAVVWCQGYGWADLSAGRGALPETPFLTASVSKAVVGVALMQAVERRSLALGTPVNTLLPFEVRHPDYPNQDITLRRLTTHTAGIADNWDVMDPLYTDGVDSPLALGDFMVGYLTPGGDWYDATQNWTWEGPGGAAEYSNIGSALAAYTVEVAEGTPFDQLCDAQIFEPLGMGNSAWTLAALGDDAPALPYVWTRGGYVTDGHYGFPDYPSGSLRSSAADMARFVLAVQGGGALDGQRVLTQESVETMLSVQNWSLDPDQGVFWYRWELDGQEVWGHNGGETGASSEILITEDGVGLVVLMNAEGRGRTLEDVELALLEHSAGL